MVCHQKEIVKDFTNVVEAIDNFLVVTGAASTSGTSTGIDPGILSPAPLNISAEENPYIHIRMKNGTEDVRGQIYFTTETDPAWSELKSTVYLGIYERNPLNGAIRGFHSRSLQAEDIAPYP